MVVDYEQLGVFYLGKKYDLDKQGCSDDELILYESRDLLTHAVCVGMTGSGKTGLCIDLLEEAAIDNIPVIAIDPKGDLSNLLLTFPELNGNSFAPWIDADEARRAQKTVESIAEEQAQKWKNGLAEWHQSEERIQLLKKSAEFAVYTPASSVGIPLSVVKSFNCPDEDMLDDRESLREYISSTATSILALLGISADPIKSREHILLCSILDNCWKQNQNLDLHALIQRIQTPPLQQVGAIPLESFFPKKERYEFALSINNLIASPGFEAWMEGEPLDIDKLFYSETGKNKVSIISIAHLPDTERMFFVSLLLGQLVSWMRKQSGTSSLRAIFYMDEILGYFPPVANPPSKAPLLTLLKQARAFGLGMVLATQNPVDLDYKALGNTGTWFIGRLQTERDKLRVLDGLEGAASESGGSFNRQEMDKLISRLSRQVFLMNNVHQQEPLIFKTRWSLSYLKGPLSRQQMKSLKTQFAGSNASTSQRQSAQQELSASQQTQVHQTQVHQTQAQQSTAPVPDWVSQLPDAQTQGAANSFANSRPVDTKFSKSQPSSGFFTSADASSSTTDSSKNISKPSEKVKRSILPPEIVERFARTSSSIAADANLVYKPMLFASAQLRFTDTKPEIDLVQITNMMTLLKVEPFSVNWEKAFSTKFGSEELDKDPQPNIEFSAIPSEATIPDNYRTWNKDFITWLLHNKKLELFACPITGWTSVPGETERDFRIRLQQSSREKRDQLLAELSLKYEPKLAALEERLAKAHQNLNQEQSEARVVEVESSLNVGASIFQALVGKKVISSTNIRRASSAANKMARVNRAHMEVDQAQGTVDRLEEQLEQLQNSFAREMTDLKSKVDPTSQPLEQITVALKKSNINVTSFCLCWAPCIRQADGKITRAW